MNAAVFIALVGDTRGVALYMTVALQVSVAVGPWIIFADTSTMQLLCLRSVPAEVDLFEFICEESRRRRSQRSVSFHQATPLCGGCGRRIPVWLLSAIDRRYQIADRREVNRRS